MDPYHTALYLHALWHQGPPNKNPNPNPNPTPNFYSVHEPSHTPFANPYAATGHASIGTHKNPRHLHAYHPYRLPRPFPPSPYQGLPRPVYPSPPLIGSSWQQHEAVSGQTAPPVSSGEPATISAVKIQQNASVRATAAVSEADWSCKLTDSSNLVTHVTATSAVPEPDWSCKLTDSSDLVTHVSVTATPAVPEADWPCKSPKNLSLTKSEWPPFKPHVDLAEPVYSADIQAKITGARCQKKVLQTCRAFFSKPADSEDSEGEEDEDDEEEEDESKEFKFLLNIFKENSGICNYYQKNYEAGEFCCLVCGAIGKKGWKKFNDCAGLLQHSTNISKTKKKRAHRAFGRVICKVLGWDFDRLPLIIKIKGDSLGLSLESL